MASTNEDVCLVRGTLATVLRLSRVMGTAGVVLERHGDSYSVRISDRTILYNKIYTYIISLLGFAGIATRIITDVIDSRNNSNKTHRELSSLLLKIVWLIVIVTTTILLSYTTFHIKPRMELMIRCLNDIQKVHKRIDTKLQNNINAFSVLIKRFLICASVLVHINLILNISLYIFVETKVDYLHFMVQGIEYNMIILILTQTSLIVLEIETVFKAINYGLQELIQICELKRQYFKSLTKGYMTLCNVVKSFNDNNSLMIGMIMIIATLYSLLTAEYLLQGIVKEHPSVTSSNAVRNLSNFLWFICHLVSIYILIEPCHRVHEKMNETQILVTKLTYSVTSAGDPIPFELDIFYKQIDLYKPTITACVFNLHRGQLSVVVVAVTTYLTVIVQHYHTDV